MFAVAGLALGVRELLWYHHAGRKKRGAKQRAEEKKRAAEEEKLFAEEERLRAEVAKLLAEEEHQYRTTLERQYRLLCEQHMRDLGIDPTEPNISANDIEEARRDIDYDPDATNIAVAGNVNSGKSSLLNAIRNLGRDDPDWAPTGASEVTAQQHRYPDPVHNCIWYDTPGAGTQSVTAFRYYYSQRLFAYDKVILVHETTLTEPDIRLLQVCNHFKQPCIVVRTKCDMHIYNYQVEREWTQQEAREAFLREVREDVARFTAQAEAAQASFAPQFDDFVVSTTGIRALVRGQRSPDEVDETRFFEALGLRGGLEQ